MVEAGPQPPFFSLPAELRLDIAAYVLEQSSSTGFVKLRSDPDFERRLGMNRRTCGLFLSPHYSAASNLSLLLVCRQFRNDFTRLAFQMTLFSLRVNSERKIAAQPHTLLRNVRKLAIRCHSNLLASWHEYAFNTERLHLDELHVVILAGVSPNRPEIVTLLRRLKYVKCIRFLIPEDPYYMVTLGYNSLIGALLKEDHYQRYDAPNAPNLESTWWTWRFGPLLQHFTMVAQEPKPVMDEEAYMLLVKPLVDDIMERAERLRARRRSGG